MEQIIILVINMNQESLIDLIEKIHNVFSNCKVLMALNWNEGLIVAKKEDPDMIFMDINKEANNNFELCRKLKSNRFLNAIPVVFLTELHVVMEIKMLAIKYGGDGFISKYVNECELVSLILSIKKIKETNFQRNNECEELKAKIEKLESSLKMINEHTIQLFRSLEKEYEIRIKSQRNLKEAQKMARLGYYEFNLSLEVISATKEALNILGIDSIEKVRTLSALSRYVHTDDWPMVREKIEMIRNEKVYEKAIFRIKKFDGEEYYVQTKMMPQYDKNRNHIGSFGVIQDITEIKKTEAEVMRLSYHDHMTGLYNRRYFDEVLMKIDCDENYPLSVIMADINGLKIINDSFGHKAGDELLKKAANVLKEGCRERDIIARLGGDEFAILIPQSDEASVKKVIQRIVSLAEREECRGIKLSISFGAQTKEKKGESIKKLMKQAEDEMYRNKLYENSSRRNSTVELIMNTLYEKSSREMMHSIRVGIICEKIGRCMKLDKDEINQVRTAGMVHDIGKIGIDEKILNKIKKLSEDEWEEIKRHPEIGYRILSSVNEFSKIANCVLEHHERWDGTGYPKGLVGQEISLQGRIVAVADSFDAITSDRVYRMGRSTIEAIDEIRKNAGTQFDPDVSRIFIENVLGMEFKIKTKKIDQKTSDQKYNNK